MPKKDAFESIHIPPIMDEAEIEAVVRVLKRIYPQPLYKAKLFKDLMGYGSIKCPFTCPYYDKDISYDLNLPVVEDICTRVNGFPTSPFIHKPIALISSIKL